VLPAPEAVSPQARMLSKLPAGTSPARSDAAVLLVSGTELTGPSSGAVEGVLDEELDAAPDVVLEAGLEEALEAELEEGLAEAPVDPSAPCNVEAIWVSTRLSAD
jgi:hypothetical protein